MKQEVKPSPEPMSEQKFQRAVLGRFDQIDGRFDRLEGKVDKMHGAFKTLLAQSGLNEDGGIAPLKLVNLEDPESRKEHGLDW